MFLCRVRELLGRELLQSTDNTEAGISRLYNIVNVAILGSIVGVAEEIFILCFLCLYRAARLSGSSFVISFA